MLSKIKTAIVAALIVGSASAALVGPADARWGYGRDYHYGYGYSLGSSHQDSFPSSAGP